MSVLRYPGGKTRAIKELSKILPDDIDTIYSPFFGGGSFELTCAKNKQIKIVGNDLFEPLINFWMIAKHQKEDLVRELRKVQRQMNKETLTLYRKRIKTETDAVQRAMYYFAINRSSFSGATFSGGFSDEAIIKRFTKSSIDRLENLDLSLCEFTNSDYQTFLETIPTDDKVFIYADPPYYLQEGSKLYGDKGDLHQTFEHDRFIDCMTRITDVPWVISYNDCDYVRRKFSEYRIESVTWAYGMNTKKTSSEVLIFGGRSCNV